MQGQLVVQVAAQKRQLQRDASAPHLLQPRDLVELKGEVHQSLPLLAFHNLGEPFRQRRVSRGLKVAVQIDVQVFEAEVDGSETGVLRRQALVPLQRCIPRVELTVRKVGVEVPAQDGRQQEGIAPRGVHQVGLTEVEQAGRVAQLGLRQVAEPFAKRLVRVRRLRYEGLQVGVELLYGRGLMAAARVRPAQVGAAGDAKRAPVGMAQLVHNGPQT